MKTTKTILIMLAGSFSFMSVAAQNTPQTSTSVNQAKKRYASSGTIELSGTLSFASQTVSSSASSATSTTTTVGIGPTFSAFIVNGFFLGVTGAVSQAFLSQSSGGATISQLSAFAAPGFALDLGGSVFPYVTGLIGYGNQTISAGSFSQTFSGVGFGGRVGAKFAIVDGALLDLGLQYVSQQYSMSGSSLTQTLGTFMIIAGFSVWF